MNTPMLRNSGRVLALVCGTLSPLFPTAILRAQAAADPAPASESAASAIADEVVVLEKFEVVGSRIKRIDAEGPNPVVAIRQSDFRLAGYSNIGEALRTLPMISGSSLQAAASNNSFTPGASTVNIRGLGNNNVLVLLNGRRAAPLSTPGFDGLQTMFDMNSIPVAAVESIEVLKDGGSALYGSDAVSGVIDVKLKRNYSGVNSTIELGSHLGTNALDKYFSVVYGRQVGKTSLVLTFDWKGTNSIQDREFSFSANADNTYRGGSDLRSYAGYPGLVYVPSLDDYYTLNTPKENPTLADFAVADVSHGTYNFQSATDLMPWTRNYGFYSHLSQELTNNLSAFVELSFRREQSRIAAAPSPVFSYNEHGTGPDTDTLNIPATNPNNPFGEDLQDEWYARLVHSGNRVNAVTSDTPRILVGLEGKIPELNDWSWESGALYTRNRAKNLNQGSVFDDLYQQALNGVLIDGSTLYANPFGPEDPRVTASYVGDNPNSSTFSLKLWDLKASGTLFELPAGPLGLALGGEARSEDFKSLKTTDNEMGNIVGGAEGSSVAGDRKVYAFYAELGIPIIKGLEAQVAARFEHYSDFGSTTKPKFALSYKPMQWLRFRSSFSQSFLAPNLSYLYTRQVTQFSDSPVADPKRPNDAPRQIQTRSGGNPDLQPEITDTIYAGFQIEPIGALKGFSVAVDWFQFKQKDLIAQLGPDLILSLEDQLPGAVVRNPPTGGDAVGVINYINDTYANVDKLTYRGFDFDLRYDLHTKNAGDFRFNVAATFMSQYVYTGGDEASELAGTYNLPQWRSTYSVDWRRGNWSAAIFVEHVGTFLNYDKQGRIGNQLLVNPQISYAGWRNLKVTLGARNIFDRDPPFDRHSSTGWNADIHNPEKAFVYVRLEREW
ncbi:MAG TPA: TonB-dependent receptor [Opitutaceae bacterium]|nr:TonB-dependent receptor [Opitutaceae bacterium]